MLKVCYTIDTERNTETQRRNTNDHHQNRSSHRHHNTHAKCDGCPADGTTSSITEINEFRNTHTALGQKIWESDPFTTRTAALDAIESDRDGTLEWAKRQARQLRALFPTCPPLTVRVEIVERLTESDVTDTVTVEQEYEI